MASDIEIRRMDTTTISLKLGERDINQLQMLYNNVSPYTYDMELLILVDCSDSSKKSGQTFELFGAIHTETEGNHDEPIETYVKELDYPIFQRNALIISFIRMRPSVSLLIYEDGCV